MKIFCINLERATERRRFMEEQFSNFNLDVEFIKAVDGRELSDEDFRHVTDENAVRASPYWLTPGAIGCALSHRLVYEKMMKAGIAHAMVLEDDVILKKDVIHTLKQLDASI